MQIDELDQTTTSVGVSENDVSDFDIGNFGGLGLLGGVIIFGGLLLANWKLSGKKSIKNRFENYEKSKETSSSTITVNDKKQETLKIVIEQKEKLADEKQKKIDEIVDNTAKQIKDVLKEKNSKVTVDRIVNNWKG